MTTALERFEANAALIAEIDAWHWTDDKKETAKLLQRCRDRLAQPAITDADPTPEQQQIAREWLATLPQPAITDAEVAKDKP